jgi:hypothetical protein
MMAGKAEFPMPGEEGTLEIRPCYALEDLSDLVPKAEFEREVLRKQVARQQKAKSTAPGKAKSKAAPARKKSAKQKRGRAKVK